MALRTSPTQFTIMVEFMEKNGDLSKPQNVPQGRQWCIRKWKELSDLLNSQGIGETRNEEKWRKVWSDLKNNTKRKWAKMNRAVHGTGGGPALKMCLNDLELRVMSILGVQAAIGMPVDEVGFGQVNETTELTQTVNPVPEEPQTDDVIMIPLQIPIDDQDWNTPGSSTDPTPVPPIPRSPTPPKSPAVPHRQPTPPPPQHHQRKKKVKTAEDFFLQCENNAREDNKERERMFVELERERIRQRDIELRQRDTELQLQAQWLEFMQEGLKILNKYLSERK